MSFLPSVASGRWGLSGGRAGQETEAPDLGAPEGTVLLMAVWMPRYLEEGNIQAAEAQKRRIEQLQRDRRKVMEENNIVHQARFFRSSALTLCSAVEASPSSPLAPSSQHLQSALVLDVHSSLSWLSSRRRQTDGSGKEWWVTNNTYWRLRAEPGYGNLDGAVLW